MLFNISRWKQVRSDSYQTSAKQRKNHGDIPSIRLQIIYSLAGLLMTRIFLSLLFVTFIFNGTHELIAGPLSRIQSRRHQRAERSHPGNNCPDCIATTREARDPTEMSAKNNPPPGFVALFNGTDLSGWYGWGTQDPDDFRNMSQEAQLEYKKKSIHGGLLNKKA